MKNDKPLVSICVPVYGVEKYIERCAKSLLDQTYLNLEYVFVNDCTKDRSMDVLNEVIGQYPSRRDQVKIVNHTENKGIAGARITCLENSEGEFISWVDPDDYIDEDMIEKMVTKATEANADIVSCNTVVHYQDKERYHNNLSLCSSEELVLAMLNRKVFVSLWARIIRRSLFVNNNIGPILGVNSGEDFQMMPKLVYFGRPAFINDYAYHYNCANTSSYTFHYSREKANGIWSSVLNLENFFQDKGFIYLNAVRREKARIIIRDMLNSCRNGYRDYYQVSMKRMTDLERSYVKTLPFSYRAVFRIGSYNVIRCIIKMIDLLRHIS
jgi:glycosyltransferase involved in cell wall biosynthesis